MFVRYRDWGKAGVFEHLFDAGSDEQLGATTSVIGGAVLARLAVLKSMPPFIIKTAIKSPRSRLFSNSEALNRHGEVKYFG